MPALSALKIQSQDDNLEEARQRLLRGDLSFADFCAALLESGYTGHIGLDFLHGRPLEYTLGRPQRCKFKR